jgi:hypothetical protein
MFAINTENIPVGKVPVKKMAKPKTTHKIYPLTSQSNDSLLAHNALHIDSILEKEKQKNKTDTWNKLDKTIKIEKLHTFALKFGNDHGYDNDDIKYLITFFNECLDKNKLQKKKDLVYDKDTYEITSIPSLSFNATTHHFTLKNIDSKRVSTLKSLTPKRTTEKNRITPNVL